MASTIIKTTSAIVTPGSSPVLARFPKVLTSDGFSGASAAVAARVTDLALGGTAKSWVASASNISVDTATSRLRATNNTATFAGINVTESANLEMRFKVPTQPASGNIAFEFRRTDAGADDSTSNCYQVRLTFVSGSFTIGIRSRTGVTSTAISPSIDLIPTGNEVIISIKGSTITISVVVSGVTRTVSVTDATYSAAGYVGVKSALTGWAIDDLIITRLS